LNLKFIGAAGTVTGSRTLLNNHNDLYWIDCGLFQGPKDIRNQNWEHLENANKLKAVILTHAHIDHSGLLPVLVKQGFRGQIICSEATADMCKILLPDSGYLQEEDARFANMKRHSKHYPALPLYTESDAVKALEFFSPQKMNAWIELSPSFRFRLSRSGHMLGSSFVEIGYTSSNIEKVITFSGDLGQPNPILLKEPIQIQECDELVLESTYGDRTHPKSDPYLQLAEVIKKVLTRKGTLVVPAFSVGRSQDLLYMIRHLEDRGLIEKYDVYLDSPMSLDATDLYIKHQDELKPQITSESFSHPLSTNRFKTVKDSDESMLLCMDDSPKIIISAAGMLTGGRVLHHLKAKLPNEKNGVLFVGYQVPGSKGYLVKNGLTSIRLHHQEIEINAGIFSIDSLSAHADSNQIISWVKGIRRKPNKIYLNHGEDIARQTLAYRIENELGIHCCIPIAGEEFKI
jgi:metallo-beta-lactamase family protein